MYLQQPCQSTVETDIHQMSFSRLNTDKHIYIYIYSTAVPINRLNWHISCVVFPFECWQTACSLLLRLSSTGKWNCPFCVQTYMELAVAVPSIVSKLSFERMKQSWDLNILVTTRCKERHTIRPYKQNTINTTPQFHNDISKTNPWSVCDISKRQV